MIEVRWTAENTGAWSFRIERSADGVTAWSSVGTVHPYDELVFRNSPIVSETRFCYRVISVNPSGESIPSNTSCTAAPNGTYLTARLADEQTIVLSWADNSNVEDGYEVRVYMYRGSFYCYPPGESVHDAGTFELEGTMVLLPANTTSWQTTPLVDSYCDPPTEYTFYVVATRDGGTSSYSNGISGTGTPVVYRPRHVGLSDKSGRQTAAPVLRKVVPPR